MGWFDEQIENRKRQELKLLDDSFQKLELIVTGSRSADHFAEGADVKDALEVLLKYYGIPDREVPPRLKTLEEKLDYLLSAADIMYREVQLERGWHVDSMGPLITTLEESGAVITVLHNSAGVYVYRDPVSGREAQPHDEGSVPVYDRYTANVRYRILPDCCAGDHPDRNGHYEIEPHPDIGGGYLRKQPAARSRAQLHVLHDDRHISDHDHQTAGPVQDPDEAYRQCGGSDYDARALSSGGFLQVLQFR